MSSCIEKVFAFVVTVLLSTAVSFSASAADIGNAAEFITAVTTDPTGSHKLAADIELSGWTPCAFSGTLDGAGHKITGLSNALFSSLTGTVKNLTIQGSATEIVIAPDADFGVLAVVASGATVENCSISGFRLVSQQVTKTIYPGMGFFVGRAYDGCSFTGCTTAADCSADIGVNVFCGGIVGAVCRSAGFAAIELAVFERCVNMADCTSSVTDSVAPDGGAFGGVLGSFTNTLGNESTILLRLCKNFGGMTVGDSAINHSFGGMVGKYEGNTATTGDNTLSIVSCSNFGNGVNCSVFGGMVGFGGPFCPKFLIDMCVNEGSVSSMVSGGCYGGFVGCCMKPARNNASTIRNSVSKGVISVDGSCSGASGAIGYMEFTTTTQGANVKFFVQNCSFEGAINGDNIALIALSGSKARSGTGFSVGNCWVAKDAARFVCPSSSGITYSESDLQIHAPGGDAAECAALNTVASGIPEYLAWKVNEDTTHPEPVMPHDVQFVDWNGTLLSRQFVADGEGALPPASPVRSGYTFAGWSPSDFAHVVADMTIRAVYNCEVTFKDWDGSDYMSVAVREGSAVEEPQTHPTKENCTFQYWADGVEQYDFSLPVLANLTLSAVFTVNTYPVVFLDWTDAQIGETQYVPHGGAAVAPPLPPVPEGMTFKMWDQDFGNVTGPLTVRAIMSSSRSVVWVSVGGFDTEGRGTVSAPYATVAYAVGSLDHDEGGTVYVTPGVYQQSKQTRLDAPIRVLGSTGNPADVILQNVSGTQSDRIFRLNHAGAMVASLTMLDGAGSPDGSDAYNYHNGGGFAIREPGGTVSNCVIRNGYALHFSSRGAGAYLYNGLVTHCVFTGAFSTMPAYNADPSAEGVVIHCNGADARIENTLICDAVPTPCDDGSSHGPVVSVVKGLMRNCTVVPNARLFATGSADAKYKQWNVDGGCAVRCGSGGRVENCAIAGLENVDGDLKPFGGVLANFYYCVGDGDMSLSGTHNCRHAAVEEMFIDPDAKDYRPRALGALVNWAFDVPGYGSICDLAGMKRVVKILDIGCYESQFVPGLVITGKRIDR